MNVLVFRIGSLGDHLIALPAIWAARDAFPYDDFYLLGNSSSERNRVSGRSLFEKTGLFKDFFQYPSWNCGGWSLSRWVRMIDTWKRLRNLKLDAVVYLAPLNRTTFQMWRDKLFFKSLGAREFFGLVDVEGRTSIGLTPPLPCLAREADQLLERLLISGLKTPQKIRRTDLNLCVDDIVEFEKTMKTLPDSVNRTWIGIGPGSNMPAKIWPRERYAEVVKKLIEKENVWPVVLGGPEDRELGRQLVEEWGCGYNFAGSLSVRASAVALSRCKLYLGNDTGTMHLAASEKVPCVAIFSSRTYPGLWYPYGDHHKIFRTQVDCEGCELAVCVEKKMKCILSIQVGEVFEACVEILKTQNSTVNRTSGKSNATG